MHIAMEKEWVSMLVSKQLVVASDCYIVIAGEHGKMNRRLGTSRGNSC